MSSQQNISPATSIQNLPNEILQKIFSYLNLLDRKAASLVCRRWANNAMHSQDIALVVKPESTEFESALPIILASERPYRHFVVHETGLPEDIYAKFADSFETLKIVTPSRFDFLNNVYKLDGLKRLVITRVRIREDFAYILTYIRQCKSVKIFEANMVHFGNFTNFHAYISSAFPALTSLRLQNCTFETGEKWRFSNLPLLEYLEVDTEHPLKSNLLAELASLPSLRTVKISCKLFNKIEQLNPNLCLNNITKLNLTVLAGDCHLLRLAELFPALEVFNISAQATYTDNRVVATARQRLPNCLFEVQTLPELQPNSLPREFQHYFNMDSDDSEGEIYEV